MGNAIETNIICEKPKNKPEIADTFDWSKEERQKLKEDVLIQNVRKKLGEKYPVQKCFFDTAIIKVMQLGKDMNEYNQFHQMINTNIFLLYSPEGKLLSYLDKDGNTMFDVSRFDFDNDLKNLLYKKQGNIFIRKNTKSGELEYVENGKIYKQGSQKFNNYIIGFLPLWDYFK